MTGRPVKRLDDMLAGNCFGRGVSSEERGSSSGSAIETTEVLLVSRAVVRSFRECGVKPH